MNIPYALSHKTMVCFRSSANTPPPLPKLLDALTPGFMQSASCRYPLAAQASSPDYPCVSWTVPPNAWQTAHPQVQTRLLFFLSKPAPLQPSRLSYWHFHPQVLITPTLECFLTPPFLPQVMSDLLESPIGLTFKIYLGFSNLF